MLLYNINRHIAMYGDVKCYIPNYHRFILAADVTHVCVVDWIVDMLNDAGAMNGFIVDGMVNIDYRLHHDYDPGYDW